MDDRHRGGDSASVIRSFGEAFTHAGESEAQVIILPVPFEASTSYGKGTANGPASILEASPNLEFFDEQLENEAWKAGIFTAEPIRADGAAELALRLEKYISEKTGAKKFVLSIGGEHAITTGQVKAHLQFEREFSVLQFDAHSDLRESFESNPYSHACVMRRIWEINKNIVSVGIRSQSKEEHRFIRQRNIPVFYAHDMKSKDLKSDILSVLKDKVFISFDVDFWDPAMMPATGTPEPGGLFWHETVDLLNAVIGEKEIIGMDIVEFSPLPGLHHPQYTVARFIYKIIGLMMFHGRINATR